MNELEPTIVLLVAGSFVCMLFAMLGALRWAQGVLSCAEAFGGACFVILFIASFLFNGVYPWNLALLGLPVLYALVSWRITLAQRQQCKELHDQQYAACRHLMVKDPKNAAAYGQLGQLLEEDGRLQEAIAAYTKSLQMEPHQDRVKYRCQKLKEQVVMLRQGQTKCPGCSTAQCCATGVCWKCGRVLDGRRRTAYRMRKLGIAGFLLLSLCVAAGTLALSCGLILLAARAGMHTTLLLTISLLLALAGGLPVGWLFKQIVAEERRPPRLPFTNPDQPVENFRLSINRG